MRVFKSAILGVAAGALLAGSALAADWNYGGNTGFDWNGFYAGFGITGSSLSSAVVTTTTGYADLIVGMNMTSGDFLFGLEGWAGVNSSSSATGYGGGVAARAGYLVTPSAVLYASAGGYFYSAGARYATLGGGVEFALNDDISIDAEYKYWGFSNNSFTGHSLGASALWHF